MPSKSKRGAGNRSKTAKTGEALLAQLDADPRMPADYTMCQELCIYEEDDDDFARILFEFAQDPCNVELMQRNDTDSFWELANRFLTNETKLLFWPSFLIETQHKFFHNLLEAKFYHIFKFLSGLKVAGPEIYFQELNEDYGGPRNFEKCNKIKDSRIRSSELLEHVLQTHMEEDDYETLLKEKMKEYEEAEEDYEKWEKSGYQRKIWIKGGNTGVFVEAEDYWAGVHDDLLGSDVEDCVFYMVDSMLDRFSLFWSAPDLYIKWHFRFSSQDVHVP
ncbi:hypothetical protein EPUS_02112 [Endocarpon pusillum Z07020]|uniref:Uncharacterized protein n=1 Tax=Endocarpon pusillum (strain Z07020 / HMAS-L-300199) TaxID=1263415 RepID=U1HPB6_ENDPU|nr:uncharacterized protein EPUS_02112 [Endocarpon pusillum Z07020]ERF72225.1 hypothetical protein EPUS_02112 [Endocarpon pusillum Z07020]